MWHTIVFVEILKTSKTLFKNTYAFIQIIKLAWEL